MLHCCAAAASSLHARRLVFILAGMPNENARPIDRLLEIMAQLREPETGCPWDVEQTFESIAPYTLEEAYEVDHAIRTHDMVGLCDELGDLLLQVVFHAQMAAESELFNFDDVARAICDKLVRRHPHVFPARDRNGELTNFETPEAFTKFWEDEKARERAERGDAKTAGPDPFDGVPVALPALARAAKLRKRADRFASSGSESVSEARSALAGVERAIAALIDDAKAVSGKEAAQELIGPLLARCVEASRSLGVDPEEALRNENDAFESRARAVFAGATAESPADPKVDAP